METRDIGTAIELKGVFTANDGADTPTDPAAVVCKVKQPDGTTSNLPTVKESTGVYTTTVVPDAAGIWFYRFEGTGGVDAQGENAFRVRVPVVTP